MDTQQYPDSLSRAADSPRIRSRALREGGVVMSESRTQQVWGIVLAGGEGTRARAFLQQLCGGRGIKQFCAVVGRRSMLQHTLARVERLIPRERILVVVSTDHRAEVTQQLAEWPVENLIYEPLNRDTAPGILLPLASLWQRAPHATVAVFPSDHFIVHEERFMASVEQALAETQRFPNELTLLGMTPDAVEDGYGWIEPARQEPKRMTKAVQHFWEKPPLGERLRLLRRGALWNTFVFTSSTTTLWEMARRATPDLYRAFIDIRMMVPSRYVPLRLAHIYQGLGAVNFSSAVCAPLASWLRVLPVPEVGWSDWGSEERILAALVRIGKLGECLARLHARRGDEENTIALLR